jgi:MFS family permease
LAGLQGFADSLSGGTVGVAFIYAAFGESNAKVGFAEALQGISSLVTAFPAGWASDRWSRSGVIKIGGVTSLIAGPLFGYAVLEASNTAQNDPTSNRAYIMMCAAFVLFGFGFGIGNGPAQALLADSIPTGSRSKYYNILFQAYIIPGVIGPVIGIVYFLIYAGDDWDIISLRDLMFVGISLQIPIAICMFSFRDDLALGRASDSVTERTSEYSATPSSGVSMCDADSVVESPLDNGHSRALHEPLIDGGDTGLPPFRSGDSGDNDIPAKEEDDDDSKFSLHPRAHYVPYIVFISGLIVALASGMTIKYFPLYFKNTLGMPPAAVQCIYVAVPLIMGIASCIATRLGKLIGRVQAILLLRSLGLACFSGMVVLDKHAETVVWGKWAIVVLYVLRTAFMNCTYPLEESILMDYVSKNSRARWKSLESIGQAGWCGSAFLGGILADSYGYTFTFVITIAVQAVGTLVYATMLGVVIGEVDEEEQDEEGRKAATRDYSALPNKVFQVPRENEMPNETSDSRMDVVG